MFLKGGDLLPSDFDTAMGLDDMDTGLKLIDYDFSNPHMLNFPEMYRSILNRLRSMDNYDNKYEKASRLLFKHRFIFWENADEQANDPCPNPKYTVYHSNRDTYFIINKDCPYGDGKSAQRIVKIINET